MVESPCQQICKMSKDGKICIGCGRTIQQISNWNYFSKDEKSKINQEILKSKLKKNSSV